MIWKFVHVLGAMLLIGNVVTTGLWSHWAMARRERAVAVFAAGAILLASENAVRCALEAVQALGGAGYTRDWPVERLLRDAKLYDIGAGTNEIRRYLIGRELTGV